MKDFLIKNKIKLATFIIICSSLIIKISSEEKPYATGDAVEYSLMTEALFNHFSPNVETADCESFKSAFIKKNKWEENDKASAYEATQAFITSTSYKPLDYECAFFVAKDGKKYSVHFFFYSLLNLPVRWICSIMSFNPLSVFHITNALLVLISCFLFFKYSKFGELQTAAFVLLFFYSTNYWYLCWVHPEVFTVCFVTVGLWLFFQDKKYIGILLVSIAALQNQPLTILSAALCLITLFSNGFRLKNILKIFLCSFLILTPSLFYYYHFGETNLIQYEGGLSFSYVTFTRVFGFFFDLNQGVVLALPFILFAYLFLVIRKIVSIKKTETKWDLLIPLTILGMTCIAATIDNWNHGQAVVNRYVTYIGTVIFVHFFFLLMSIENKKRRNTILIVALFCQIGTVFYHQSLSKFDWSTSESKPIATWVLNHCPQLYNPDPIIFIARYTPIDKLDESPAYYAKKSGEITKFLVNRNYLYNLERFGFTKKQIDEIAPHLHYIIGWAYINVNGNFHSNFTFSELKNIDNQRKLDRQIKTIKSNLSWYESVKQKGKTLGITEQEALRRDAAYVLGIEDSGTNETIADKIKNKINQIRATPSWLKLIEAKATEKKISLDSALYNDAKWTVEQEIQK
jgi:hypothetical protein